MNIGTGLGKTYKIKRMTKKHLEEVSKEMYATGKEQGIKIGIEQQKKEQHAAKMEATTRLISAAASNQEAIARMIMAIERY
jgi:hypothetical protein